MDKKELEILIDKSVLGTITNKEKSKLDEYIMKQPNTTLEIKMRKDILKGIEYSTDQELKVVLDQIHKEEITKSPKIISFARLAKAAILIGLLVGTFAMYTLLNDGGNANSTELYATYYQPFESTTETRSSDEDMDKTTLQFIDLYQSKKYQESLEAIRPVVSSVDNNTLLLAGISAMEIGELNEAQSYLNQIIESNDYYFADHAKWYKALVFLKLDDTNAAKSLLEELATDPKADHNKESIEILEKI